jgi:hypothetical protein
MPVERMLQRIRAQIAELTASIDAFGDESVQPAVADCEKLQRLLAELQENLAIYKFHKTEKELSPSFNIHARISDAQPTPSGREGEQAPQAEEIRIQPKTDNGKNKTEVMKQLRSVGIGINDKFRFINELFAQNVAEYNIAIEQLNNLGNWGETEVYLASLRNLYGWKENSEVVKHFYGLAKKRFQ